MKVYRFNKTERLAHAFNGAGFLALLATGLLLLFRKNLGYGETAVQRLVQVHLISAGVYILGPLFCWLMGHTTSWVRWIRDAAAWGPSDIPWLFKVPFYILGMNVNLPDQKRFNPGQRINIWGQFIAKILFLYSGFMLWFAQGHLWMVYLHLATAAFSLSLLMVHLYLAVVCRYTRPGLKGMITGWVEAEWARHHYTKWYERQPADAFRAPVESPKKMKKTESVIHVVQAPSPPRGKHIEPAI